MKFSLFNPPRLLGLDIQACNLRIICARQQRADYWVEQVFLQDFPPHLDVFKDNKISRWDRLCVFLSDIVTAYGLQGCLTIVSLPARLVRIERLELPQQFSPLSIETEITTYLQPDFAHPREALAIDFAQINKQAGNMQTVHFAVARKEYIAKYAECIKAAGLNLKVIDIDIYCLKRLLPTFKLRDENTLLGLIYLNQGIAILIICNHIEIIFHATWTISTIENFAFDLNCHLQMGCAQLGTRSIQQWFVCCDEKYKLYWHSNKMLLPAITSDIKWLALKEQIKNACTMDEELFNKHAADFALALGSIKRPMPLW